MSDSIMKGQQAGPEASEINDVDVSISMGWECYRRDIGRKPESCPEETRFIPSNSFEGPRDGFRFTKGSRAASDAGADASFVAMEKFSGARTGYRFGTGPHGSVYYREAAPQMAPPPEDGLVKPPSRPSAQATPGNQAFPRLQPVDQPLPHSSPCGTWSR